MMVPLYMFVPEFNNLLCHWFVAGIIIGTYNENHQPGNARNTVVTMADYLKNLNY